MSEIPAGRVITVHMQIPASVSATRDEVLEWIVSKVSGMDPDDQNPLANHDLSPVREPLLVDSKEYKTGICMKTKKGWVSTAETMPDDRTPEQQRLWIDSRDLARKIPAIAGDDETRPEIKRLREAARQTTDALRRATPRRLHTPDMLAISVEAAMGRPEIPRLIEIMAEYLVRSAAAGPKTDARTSQKHL